MNEDFKRGYSRGYNTHCNSWPKHKPPLPPEPFTRALMDAAMQLRDEIDAQLATFEENDPLDIALSPYIQKLDDALASISCWLRSTDQPGAAGDEG